MENSGKSSYAKGQTQELPFEDEQPPEQAAAAAAAAATADSNSGFCSMLRGLLCSIPPILILALLTIGAGVALGIGLKNRNSISGSGFTEEHAKDLILQASPDTEFGGDDPNTPQQKALDWVLKDPYLGRGLEHGNWRDGDHDAAMLQRFALATFYYSLGGSDDWNDDGDSKHKWLSDSNECMWSRRYVAIGCNDLNAGTASFEYEFSPLEDLVAMVVTTWSTPRGILNGTIPLEVAMLNLNTFAIGAVDGISAFPLNAITGTIPPQLLQDNKNPVHPMENLLITHTAISGTIPTEIGVPGTNTFRLDLQRNFLVGPVPSEIGALVGAQSINLAGNLFWSDTIPSSLCNRSQVANDLAWTVPTIITDWTVDCTGEDDIVRACPPCECCQVWPKD